MPISKAQLEAVIAELTRLIKAEPFYVAATPADKAILDIIIRDYILDLFDKDANEGHVIEIRDYRAPEVAVLLNAGPIMEVLKDIESGDAMVGGEAGDLTSYYDAHKDEIVEEILSREADLFMMNNFGRILDSTTQSEVD